MNTIDIHTHAKAPTTTVWDLLADTSTWSDWSGFDAVASESGHGSGQIRVLQTGETVTREQVSAFESGRRYAYRHLTGLPVRTYQGEITLAPRDDGTTDIHWHARFSPLYPETERLVHEVLERVIADAAAGLARTAQERTRTSSYILQVTLQGGDDERWTAVGGGETLANALDYALASAPTGTNWQFTSWEPLYGD